MTFNQHKIGAVLCSVTLLLAGCSKEAAEAPIAPAADTTPAPAATPGQPAPAAPAAVVNVQQIQTSFDTVTKQIAAQDYDNAVRQALVLNQAQLQAQVNDAARMEYSRRLRDVQEALRQKAETDPKAREAYQKLGRAMMGR
jgi:PBP1b-binding outer membrane lipoprotein LpoB